jgi:hypothetical protein
MSGSLSRHAVFPRIVAVLLLMWIAGDMVGTGVCPNSVDPCCDHEFGTPDQSGLPHGTHSGMMTLHQGHCLAHGLVTMTAALSVPDGLGLIQIAPVLPPAGAPRDVAQSIDHPPQLAAR